MNPRPEGPIESVTFLEVHGPPALPALWLRYTWCDHTRREARLWGVAWTPAGVVAETRARPLSELRRWDPDHVDTACGSLTPDRAEGDVGPLRWDLALEHRAPPHDLVPETVGRIGRTYRSLSPDLRVTGTVHIHGVPVVLRGARGVMGHIRGRRNRVARWVWAHAAGLVGHDDAVFEGLCARLGPAAAPLPPMTSVRLRWGRRELVFSGLADLVSTQSTLSDDAWAFVASGPQGRLSGHVQLGPPGDTALVEYRDEHDRSIWCRNAPFSTLRLAVDVPGEPTLHLQGVVTAEAGSRSRCAGRRTAPRGW